MKRAYPAFCPGQEWVGNSLDAGFKHYEAAGFSWFDGDENWATFRRGVFEAYVRPADVIRMNWIGSVIQLEECPIGDCANQNHHEHEPCYRSECGQVNDGVACDIPRVGDERICPDCNPRAA